MSERSRSRSAAEASTDDVAQPESAVLSPRLLREWPLPVPDGGKHARGTVLVIGGAPSTVGAVLLAGVAALRAGAGVLQLAVAQSRAAALAVAVPEAAVFGLPETDGSIDGGPAAGRLTGAVGQARVVLLGPGLDDVDGTQALLRGVVPALAAGTALVLDPYRLRALAPGPELGGRAAALHPT